MALPEEELQDKPVKSDKTGYFKVIVTALKPDTFYPLQFRWAYKDGTYSQWSAIKSIFTPASDAPAIPKFLPEDLTSDGKNFIVTWSGVDKDGNQYPPNFKEIEVWYKNIDSGGYLPYSSKITKANEPLAIPAVLGSTYQVKLRAINTSGVTSGFSDVQTVLIEAEKNSPIQNVQVEWSGGNLVFTVEHDLSLESNKTLDYYLAEINYLNSKDYDRIQKTPGGSIHKDSFTSDENKDAFGFPLKTALSGNVYTVAVNGSPANPFPWVAPAKTSTLPAPTITVSKGTGYYSVAWTQPSNTLPDKVAVIVIEESSSQSGPWTQVAKSSTNPVDIQSNSSTKYVRAIFYDTNDLPGSGYSTVYSVTPDPVVSEDTTTPAAPSSVSVLANTLSEYELKNGVGSISVSWTISDLATYSKHGGALIEYKLTTDTGYNSIFVPFTTSSPKYSQKIENLIQGLSYNIRVASINGNTLKQSSFTTSNPSTITVLSSTSISKPQTPQVFVGSGSTITDAGPLTVRVRQYSLKSNGTDIEKDIKYFEIWAIPSTYTSANDSVSQKIGTLSAAASGGNMNYVEGNFTVNVQQGTLYKFYTKAVNNGGYSSVASDLTSATSIPFMSNAYISDLSADKITTGTLAATQYITIGTGTNAIKIASATTDASTYIQSGTGGYSSSGFYADASGRFSLKDKLTFDSNNLVVKGTVDIQGSSTVTGNLTVSSGTIIAGTAGGNRVAINSSGLAAYYSGSETTRIIANPTGVQTSFYTSSAELGGSGTGSGGWIVNSSQIKKNNVVLDASNSAIYTTNTSNTFYVGLASPSNSNDLLFWAGGPPSNKTSNLTFGVFSNGKVQIGQYTDVESKLGTITQGISASDVKLHLGGQDVSTIDGGIITTGIIKSWGFSGTANGSSYASAGAAINLGGSSTPFSLTATNFRIDQSGNAFFKGDITATAGRIGGTNGWSIGDKILTSNDNNTYIYNPQSTDGAETVVLKIGDTFTVKKSGKLEATNVSLTGIINATQGGTIGGWTINSSSISSVGTYLYSSGKIVVGTTGDDALQLLAGSNISMFANSGSKSSIFFYRSGYTGTLWDSQLSQTVNGNMAIQGNTYVGEYPYVMFVNTYSYTGADVRSYLNSTTQETLKVTRVLGSQTDMNTDIAAISQMIQFYKSYPNNSPQTSWTNTAVGGISARNTTLVPVFFTGSDERLKKNIELYSVDQFINDIKNINVYKWHDNMIPDDGPKNIGFLAKEFYPTYSNDIIDGVPDAVDEDGEPEYMKIYRENLIPHMFATIKYLVNKVESLEDRIENNV